MLRPNLRCGILLYSSNACQRRCAAQAAPALPAASVPPLSSPVQLKRMPGLKQCKGTEGNHFCILLISREPTFMQVHT